MLVGPNEMAAREVAFHTGGNVDSRSIWDLVAVIERVDRGANQTSCGVWAMWLLLW